jgi:hypothetical protein
VSGSEAPAGRPLRRAGLALICLALALGASGLSACGDDDSETTTPTTEPATPTGPTGPTSGEEPGAGGADQDGGGDVDLEDGTVTPPPETDPENLGAEPQDSPENDTPPPPGSPAEQFEKFCDENPEACG